MIINEYTFHSDWQNGSNNQIRRSARRLHGAAGAYVTRLEFGYLLQACLRRCTYCVYSFY